MYELLEKEAQEKLDKMKKNTDEQKRNIDKTAGMLEEAQKFYSNELMSLSGIGSVGFIFELLLRMKDSIQIEKYCKDKGIEEEGREFLKNSKERMNIITEAQKNGLVVDFDPKKDIGNFIKGLDKYSSNTMSEMLKKVNLDEFANKYKKFTDISSEFIKEKLNINKTNSVAKEGAEKILSTYQALKGNTNEQR